MPEVPPDEVVLLKLFWHPDEIEEDQAKVKPTAFRKNELSGAPDCHVSADRGDMARRETMDRLVASQQEKADGQTLLRVLALIGRMPCGAVRKMECGGEAALMVSPFPLADNPAHCGIHSTRIRNVGKAEGRAFVDEVRAKLARLASPVVSMSDAYRDAS